MIARFEHIALSSSKNLLCRKSVPELWYYVCYILKRIIIPCTNHLALLEECPWQLALSLSHHERVLVSSNQSSRNKQKKVLGNLQIRNRTSSSKYFPMLKGKCGTNKR